jgi:Uma2 family endonuclease
VLAAELGMRFGSSRNGPGGWIMLNKPELHFGNDVLVPDITGWSRNRLPTLPNVEFMTLAPDWICEVLWPFTEVLDRSKLRIYARKGVEHAWLLDPVRKTLEVLVLRTGTWAPLVEHEGGGKVRAPPFDAVEIELDALWI